jgi:nucleoside-diphosphate-sugar epimerase
LSGGRQKAVLILGCGYFGKMLAQKLAFAGRFVVGTVRRDVEVGVVRTRGAEPVLFDGADVSELERYRGRIDAVVQSIPPLDPEAEASLVGRLAEWGVTRGLYISSTSVYGDHGGAVVTEDSACSPDSPKGRARLEAERIWAAAPFTTAILRPSGIYGPGRSLLHRLAAGRYRLVGDGDALTNRIHVADLVNLADAALKSPEAGAVHLATDGHAASQREVVDWICARYPLAAPEAIPLAEARIRLDKDTLAMAVQSKRLDPARTLSSLGVALRYPDYKAGLEAIWLRERKQLEALARESGRLVTDGAPGSL